MLMKYSSERFTRSLILSVSNRMKDRERYAHILAGSESRASAQDRETYFKYGSAFFTVSGVTLILMGIVAMVFTLIFYGLLGFGFFFYYAPGAILTATGYGLGLWEKKSREGEDERFNTGHLLLCWGAGCFVALVVATFSALNVITSKM